MLAPADWFIFRGFGDAARDFRGTYSDEAGYRAIVTDHGGLVPIVDTHAARIGLTKINVPRRGSVGVVGSADHIHRQFGAIFDGARWMLRTKDRFEPMIAKPLTIWDD